MKVKEIIITALNYVDRGDISAALSDGAALSDEQDSAVKTMLFCYNAVENELARYYFPLEHTQNLVSPTGSYSYTGFMYSPVKILGVTDNGKAVDYTVNPKELRTESKKITVCYSYVPQKKTIDGDSAFSGMLADEAVIAAGAASEYCLLNGEISLAELWESRYRGAIDRASKNFTGLNIPPRRWV